MPLFLEGTIKISKEKTFTNNEGTTVPWFEVQVECEDLEGKIDYITLGSSFDCQKYIDIPSVILIKPKPVFQYPNQFKLHVIKITPNKSI